MAVDIKVAGNTLVAGVPHILFPQRHITFIRNRYAVTRDGQRFLVIVPEDEGPPPPPVVVMNWPALLKKK